MKKLRRIEITAFRRRTTVTVRSNLADGLAATSLPDLIALSTRTKRQEIQLESASGAPREVDDHTSVNQTIKHSGG